LFPTQLCKECFFAAFEEEVHKTISTNDLFKPGDKVAIGASGGKDSTVLAYIMGLLNKRHKCVGQLPITVWSTKK
jgi:cytoplasmic tRNA 2-thiolation protein 1